MEGQRGVDQQGANVLEGQFGGGCSRGSVSAVGVSVSQGSTINRRTGDHMVGGIVSASFRFGMTGPMRPGGCIGSSPASKADYPQEPLQGIYHHPDDFLFLGIVVMIIIGCSI